MSRKTRHHSHFVFLREIAISIGIIVVIIVSCLFGWKCMAQIAKEGSEMRERLANELVDGINTNDTDADSGLQTVTLPSQQSSGLWNERITSLSRSNLEQDEDLSAKLVSYQEINENVGAILSIPDLDICEPVLCGAEDNKTWLRTDIRGNYSVGGAVFLDYRCNIDTSAVKLIHGHNMANDTMFGRVPEYMEYESCEDIGPVYLYLPEGRATYEVYSVLSVNSKEEALPINPLATHDELSSLSLSLLERSLVPGGVVHSLDTLVLNTCWYGESGNEHFLHCLVVLSKV